jgi:hypothetical protein
MKNHCGVKDVVGFPTRYRSLGVLQDIKYVIASCVGWYLGVNGVMRSALPMVT